MAIKGIIFDLSNTLIDDSNLPVEGIPELIEHCKSLGLTTFVVSNDDSAADVLSRADIIVDHIITKKDTGKRKPSPVFIEMAQSISEIPTHKLVYVGDDDMTDAICASHAKVLYLSALWANPDPKYGIRIKSPETLGSYIDINLSRTRYWYWSINTEDRLKRNVVMKSLIDCGSGTEFGKRLKNSAVSVLKRGASVDRLFVMNQLFCSIYLDGLPQNLDFWTSYPGHRKGSELNSIMAYYLDLGAKESRDKYKPIFHRHTTAEKSAYKRHSGGNVDFENQIKTVNIIPDMKGSLKGKSILVVDDFSTNSFSFEWARNLLLQAGAENVILIAVGKYGNRYGIYSPKDEVSWDPFSKCTLNESDFHKIQYSGKSDTDSSVELEQAYEKYLNFI